MKCLNCGFCSKFTDEELCAKAKCLAASQRGKTIYWAMTIISNGKKILGEDRVRNALENMEPPKWCPLKKQEEIKMTTFNKIMTEGLEETNFATPGCIEAMNKMLEPSKIDLIMALDTLAGAYAKKKEDGTYILEGQYKEAYETLKDFINKEEK